jgi:hypothetical protein
VRGLVTLPAAVDRRPTPRGDTTRRAVLRPLQPVVRRSGPLMVDAKVQPLRIVRTPGSRVSVTARPAMLRGATLVERTAADPPWTAETGRARRADGPERPPTSAPGATSESERLALTPSEA